MATNLEKVRTFCYGTIYRTYNNNRGREKKMHLAFDLRV